MATVILNEGTNMTTIGQGVSVAPETSFPSNGSYPLAEVYRSGFGGATLFGSFFGDSNGENVNGIATKAYLDSGASITPSIEIRDLAFDLTVGIYNSIFAAGLIFDLAELLLAKADTITGSFSNDTILGFGGNDVMSGMGGVDQFDGGAGNDTVSYALASGGLFAGIENEGSNTGAATGEGYTDVENLIGTRFNDTLYGDAGVNRLSGGAGNDTLCGKDGGDVFSGGAGTDKVSYDVSLTNIRVSLLQPSLNTGAAQGDRYTSIENIAGGGFNDHLTGNNLANTISGNNFPDLLIVDNDRLFGLGGNDNLLGYMGNDQLTGGLGRDRLTGGSHADRFIFNSAAESSNSLRDTIVDFVRAQGDRIYLSAIDARTDVGGNQAFTFIGTAAFTGVSGQLRYQKVGSDSHIQGDTNGDGVADLYIVSSNPVSFVKGDFVL
jgi:serralysin